jgi:Bacterial protein of unknown function (DUF899)
MTAHNIGARARRLAARLGLLEAEKKELTRRGDELARRRRQLPWVPVDNEYVFDTDDEEKTLLDARRCSSITSCSVPVRTAGCPAQFHLPARTCQSVRGQDPIRRRSAFRLSGARHLGCEPLPFIHKRRSAAPTPPTARCLPASCGYRQQSRENVG